LETFIKSLNEILAKDKINMNLEKDFDSFVQISKAPHVVGRIVGPQEHGNETKVFHCEH
jgi:hypothetical protein